MKTTLSDNILLQALLDRSLDLIYFKDTQGRFIRTSRSLARWFGKLDPVKLIGKTDYDIFSQEHADAAAADEHEIMRTQIPIEGKIEKETWPDGSITWVSTSKMPLYGEGGDVIGIHGISHDITLQKRASIELEQLAHDLRDRNVTLEQDLTLAAEVFEIFGTELPATLPVGAPPDSAPVHCASHYQPAERLGGDFYLVAPGQPGHVRILLCDVMGHGMQAALVAVLLRTWAQHSATSPIGLPEWMSGLNNRMAESFLARKTTLTATALAMDLDLERGIIELVRAGHPAPLLQRFREKDVVALAHQHLAGPGLGLMPHSVYRASNTHWATGDRLVLFTDGLLEARSGAGEDFDVSGVTAALYRSADLAMPEVLPSLLAEAKAHQGCHDFADDVCILAFERRV